MNKLAELARKKSFEHLDLNECSLAFAWEYPEIEIKDITVEEKGKFRIEGEISIKRRALRGTIKLGLTREYLDWLPNPEEVFSRRAGGYMWTDVHLSGTIADPGQGLTQRIIDLFKESPGAYLGLLFRQFGDWLKKTFDADWRGVAHASVRLRTNSSWRTCENSLTQARRIALPCDARQAATECFGRRVQLCDV